MNGGLDWRADNMKALSRALRTRSFASRMPLGSPSRRGLSRLPRSCPARSLPRLRVILPLRCRCLCKAHESLGSWMEMASSIGKEKSCFFLIERIVLIRVREMRMLRGIVIKRSRGNRRRWVCMIYPPYHHQQGVLIMVCTWLHLSWAPAMEEE